MSFRKIISLILSVLTISGVLTLFSYGNNAPEDIWQVITDYENSRLEKKYGKGLKKATSQEFASLSDGIAEIVESWSGYLPGSIERHGDFIFWDGTDGIGYGYSPFLRERMRTDLAAISDNSTTTAKASSSLTQAEVATFQPFYGYDMSFSGQYCDEGASIAKRLGNSFKAYLAGDATIGALAYAVSTSRVVIIDTHGLTDYTNGDDYTTRANTSYVCLQSGDGITSEDSATVKGKYGNYKHAFYAGVNQSINAQVWAVDGTAIANHMPKKASGNLVWIASCLGMATDGLQAPLRKKGVEVVYGHSQSVTFKADYAWEEQFWNVLKTGGTVAQGISKMKSVVGFRDPYEDKYPSYPIVVSSIDAYPGKGYVDAKQTVRSAWKLGNSTAVVNAVSNDLNFGTVSVSGNVITAKPKSGCFVSGYEVIEGKASVSRKANVFTVTPKEDCTVKIIFDAKIPVKISFSCPYGAYCSSISAYAGDQIKLPQPTGFPAAYDNNYKFVGWTYKKASLTDIQTPEILYVGSKIKVGENMTLYALYYNTKQLSLPCGGWSTCPGLIFSDMPKESHWSHKPIDWAIYNGITGGTSANTFSPNSDCTRAQIVTFLWKAAGSPKASKASAFTDIKSKAYYKEAADWAVSQGITAGTGASTFGPDLPCTRAQIVTFLWRYAGSQNPHGSLPFTDVPGNKYYSKAVAWAVENGITAGISDTLFGPDSICSRAQIVTFLYKYFNV